MTPQGWENHRAELASVPARSLCPMCKGTGWLIRNERAIETIQQAKDALMRCPTCGADTQRAWIRRHCGLEPSERQPMLHYWRTNVGDETMSAQRKGAKQAMIDAIKGRAGIYTFWGDFGSGKTLALQIVLNQLREHHIVDGYYAPMELILAHLRALISQRQQSSEFWQRLLDVPVLAIDEVTRINATDWALSQLFALVDTRYRRRHSHLTLFATNDDPRQARSPEESIGYLFSRMREGVLVELRGDVRLAVNGA